MAKLMSIHDLDLRGRSADDESSLSAVARIAFAGRPPGEAKDEEDAADPGSEEREQ